jgi:hypothetical protein
MPAFSVSMFVDPPCCFLDVGDTEPAASEDVGTKELPRFGPFATPESALGPAGDRRTESAVTVEYQDRRPVRVGAVSHRVPIAEPPKVADPKSAMRR